MSLPKVNQAAKPNLSQAVVVIHGIGEQRPMDTLRSFVEATLNRKPEIGLGLSSKPTYYSKPDLFSDSFELRCLRMSSSRPRTDFFEFYWAHHMPSATWTRVFEWVRLLLGRWVHDVPPQLRGLWWFLWGTSVLICILLAFSILSSSIPAIQSIDWFEESMTLPVGGVVLLLFLQAVVLSYIGDAAIYLSPNPKNVEARHTIRSAGVNLIERLHQSGRYDRIIVVGHSLGSVIGYDVLTYAWQRFHEQHGSPLTPQHDSLKVAEGIAKQMHSLKGAEDIVKRSHSPTSKEAEALKTKWAEATRALQGEYRKSGNPWLVTDFVTLGSPLAHADILLAQSRDDFTRKVCQRELPICPPTLSSQSRFSYPMSYLADNGAKRTIFVLHEAAWLAVVRWTNIYFPCRFFFYGDIVGGPVASLFGFGVRDIPVQTCIRRGWLAHNHYWKRDARDTLNSDGPIKQLLKALDLWDKEFPK